MRLTIVQYAGDYREAWQRFESGGKATYQAQRYSVNFVGSLAQRLEQVAVVCAVCEERYDEILPNGVRAIGGGLRPGFSPRELVPLLAGTHPDRLCLTTPMVPLLRWARKHGVHTITAFADSFRKGGLRTALRHRALARELNGRNVEWVGNHGIGACLSLLDIGVGADKVIPWDWPPSHKPDDYAPRKLRLGGPMSLVFVGSVEEAKGVGDLLRAIHELKKRGNAPRLTVIGAERDGAIRDLATRLGLDEEVRFAGLVPNEDVPVAMREADAVVIPSRHEYPEGLPLTIYEALAARTPIIASDHPMFRGALNQEQSALVFSAGDAEALAAAIERLSEDQQLYAQLSANSEAAWTALQLPVSWGSLLEKWLSGSAEDQDWLRAHRLPSGIYDRQIADRRLNA
jgi:glycosyltransferase involved in cell wall biosynthesis